MGTTGGAVTDGGVHHVGGSSVLNVGGRVSTTWGAGFCFPSGHNAGGTWEGDTSELASRFLAAIGEPDKR